MNPEDDVTLGTMVAPHARHIAPDDDPELAPPDTIPRYTDQSDSDRLADIQNALFVIEQKLDIVGAQGNALSSRMGNIESFLSGMMQAASNMGGPAGFLARKLSGGNHA